MNIDDSNKTIKYPKSKILVTIDYIVGSLFLIHSLNT